MSGQRTTDGHDRAPDALLGLWRRTELALAEPGEAFRITTGAEHVLWFQARTRYADLRFGEAPSFEHGAFCGRQHWDWPKVRFHHEIDSNGVFENDEGTLEFLDADTMIETGEVELGHRKLRLRERWERQRLAPQPQAATPPRSRELRASSGALEGLELTIERHRVLVYRTSGGVNAFYSETTDAGHMQHEIGLDQGPLPETRHFTTVDG